jgi:hypothetical protein
LAALGDTGGEGIERRAEGAVGAAVEVQSGVEAFAVVELLQLGFVLGQAHSNEECKSQNRQCPLYEGQPSLGPWSLVPWSPFFIFVIFVPFV